MNWWLWLLVAIGALPAWFFLGAIASFWWSQWGWDARDGYNKGEDSKFLYCSGPIGLLLIIPVIYGYLFEALLKAVIRLLGAFGRIGSLKLLWPFRKIGRI